MITLTRFVIYKPNRDHYLTKEKEWTAYIEKAKPYKTMEEAKADLESLPSNLYRIDIIYFNKP